MDLYINERVAKIKNTTVPDNLHNNTNNFLLSGVIGYDIARDKKIVIDFPNRLFSVGG